MRDLDVPGKASGGRPNYTAIHRDGFGFKFSKAPGFAVVYPTNSDGISTGRIINSDDVEAIMNWCYEFLSEHPDVQE